MEIGYLKQTHLIFEKALARTKEKLATEGFSVVTEINIQETFKQKLDLDYTSYTILGVCHAPSAYQVLEADKELGLLLPCNVLVYEDKGNVFVSAIKPKLLIEMVGQNKLQKLAQEIENKLIKVVDLV